MRILICGDVDARTGRESVAKWVPELKKKFSIDFVIVNADNAAGGFGITADIANEFFAIGADILTGGNHVFDQGGICAFLETENRLLRPYNLTATTPGHGVSESTTAKGKKVVVIHLVGQRFMPMIGNDPFESCSQILSKYTLGVNVDAIVVDFHAEFTSEKYALGHFLDGKVSAVVGTHTHIPTADEHILEHGTAFQADLGMCGDYDSVIGAKKADIVEKFTKVHSKVKIQSATGESTFCALMVDTDDKTGLATAVRAFKLGGCIGQASIS